MSHQFYGEAYPVKRLSHLFLQSAEAVRQKARQFQANVTELTSGGDAWKGAAARAYKSTSELMYNQMDRMIIAYENTAATLGLISDRLEGINALWQRIGVLSQQLQGVSYETDHQSFHQISDELHRLHDEVVFYEGKYNDEAIKWFAELRYQLPDIGHLRTQIEQAAFVYNSFFSDGGTPVLVGIETVQGRTGRDRIDFLNDSILLNGVVYDYYKNNPHAIGPNGETAEEMMKQAHALQEEARRLGGTYGVPVVFMHGLWGGNDTFETMAEAFGGVSMQYKFDSRGTVIPTEGENDSPESPLIQFSFEDGAMHFDDQTEAYKKLVAQMKKDYNTHYFIVVAHSMGGIVTTQYIEETGGQDITKFVTLGSPIKGSKADSVGEDALLGPVTSLFVNHSAPAVGELRSDSDAIEKLDDNKGSFNKNINIFSGAGTGLSFLGDGVVTPDSALGLKDFTDSSHFTSKIYDDANHSQMHEHTDIIVDVHKFIYYGEKPDHAK